MIPKLRQVRRALAVASAAGLAACGAGGVPGGGTQPVDMTLPDQSTCAYRYLLTTVTPKTGTDPLLARQWNLVNAGQTFGTPGEDARVVAAWSTTKGSGARIAIVDDAIETLHEDLQPNVVQGASYNYRNAPEPGNVNPLPCASGETHGTQVAGVAAARDDNALGGAGVAPRAGIVGYNALATSRDSDVLDALNRGYDTVGVYNSSWGSEDDGRINPAPSSFANVIQAGIDSGRGGKGAIYVFPSGNGGCFTLDSATGKCQSETSGIDGYVNHRGVIPVCAVDQFGRAPSYGEPGANILVCAPSSGDTTTVGITTTAVKNTYVSDFGGTSASAPTVSGVVAMMLAVNPSLTWRDVRWLLAKTARRNDTGNAGWAQANGLWFNPKYGFGVVNAQDAVAAAKTWASVGGSASQKSCGPFTATPNVALPDARGALVTPRENTLTVGADCAITQVEYVEIGFDSDHPYAGDLRVELTSPHGLVSTLASEHSCLVPSSGDACGVFANWTFGSARHLGEAPAGQWKLRVTDMVTRNSGNWNSWSLRIWGR